MGLVEGGVEGQNGFSVLPPVSGPNEDSFRFTVVRTSSHWGF